MSSLIISLNISINTNIINMILVSGSGLFNSEDMIRSVSRSLCGVKKDLIYWSPREDRKNIEISYADAAANI